MNHRSADDDERDDWRTRAEDAIPGGSSTGSKRAAALYGSESHDNRLPTHFERASGCRLITTEGARLVDCSMALGAVSIGYADASVTQAVIEAASSGNVSGLPHKLEVEVAERLIEVIPCAEQVRFLRTGAEANAAAIRTARTFTSRTHIIACGYFGWLDWSSDAAGVPSGTKSETTWVQFNDVESLNTTFAVLGTSVAALIIEPLVDVLANAEWLQRARALCDTYGAVLIFDEVKTAFRVRTGGVQALLGIEPDLTTLGKALANGYPLSALVGRAAVMHAVTQTWISSTAAAESTGLAAANAVLDLHDRSDVCARLAEIGNAMKDCVATALSAVPSVDIRAEGEGVMWRLVASDPAELDALVATATRHGVLLKRGAYQFASLAHDDEAIREVQHAVVASLRDIVA
ncbi:MAG: aminotransferase class III-fold pyridoxal phosphate-dependent enzyme [Phycisphaerae bacterium]|nr:aminotransferase class III-fold pyridoxal phosphate-dependent enzyme [Gemmatimonadaceae bacterium]